MKYAKKKHAKKRRRKRKGENNFTSAGDPVDSSANPSEWTKRKKKGFLFLQSVKLS